MSQLREGPETVELYPAVERDDGRGNMERVPGPDPVPLEGVWVFPVDSSITTQGQSLRSRYELTCADFPAGAWSKVSWDGRDFDVVGEPAFLPGSERVRHWVVQLQARKPKAAPKAVPSG